MDLHCIAQCSKNPRPQARGEVCRSLTEDDELNGPQRPHLNTPVSRTPLMRSLPSILPETSTTQHKEPSPSREPVKGRIFPRVDSVDELDICRITDDGPSLPVTHSKRPVLYRLPNMPDGTNSPTSTTIPARPVNLGQMVHKRHQTMLHYDGEANLRESPPMRQEGNASNAFSTISISRTAIELQPNIVEPSLLQDPLSPSRPAAHIELPHRRVSENLTHDTQHVLRSVEGGSPKLTDSLSYLRTLSKAKKATAGSASAISKRYQSHSNVPNTTL